MAFSISHYKAVMELRERLRLPGQTGSWAKGPAQDPAGAGCTPPGTWNGRTRGTRKIHIFFAARSTWWVSKTWSPARPPIRGHQIVGQVDAPPPPHTPQAGYVPSSTSLPNGTVTRPRSKEEVLSGAIQEWSRFFHGFTRYPFHFPL